MQISACASVTIEPSSLFLIANLTFHSVDLESAQGQPWPFTFQMISQHLPSAWQGKLSSFLTNFGEMLEGALLFEIFG